MRVFFVFEPLDSLQHLLRVLQIGPEPIRGGFRLQPLQFFFRFFQSERRLQVLQFGRRAVRRNLYSSNSIIKKYHSTNQSP